VMGRFIHQIFTAKCMEVLKGSCLDFSLPPFQILKTQSRKFSLRAKKTWGRRTLQGSVSERPVGKQVWFSSVRSSSLGSAFLRQIPPFLSGKRWTDLFSNSGGGSIDAEEPGAQAPQRKENCRPSRANPSLSLSFDEKKRGRAGHLR